MPTPPSQDEPGRDSRIRLTWPNRISVLRLLLVPPFVLLLLNHQDLGPAARYAALGVFALLALSDSIDGILARRLGERTRLGAVLDPLADKVLILCAVVLLSLRATGVRGAILPDWLVVVVVGKDLWVLIGFLLVYMVTGRFRVRPSVAGKATTVAQLLLVACVLISPEINALREGAGSGLVTTLSGIVAVLSILAVIHYTRDGLRFAAREQQPMDKDDRDRESRHD